ncbi:alpha/beta fold hydrolase [Pacificispira sp.]|uniref:alpha/beta fold hydrolase n=1 Tax=Pacificispira sp. TaxID=2888761 RepID=UPI003BAB9884
MPVLDLAYSEIGDGAPLVVLHGLFGNKRNWGAIAKSLAEEYRVITVDLRNHGESPWDSDMAYPVMAADVAALIEKLVGGPTHVIGHSMGGKTSMVLAFDRPDLVDRLVVADIPPAPRDSGLMAYVRAMQAMDTGAMKRRAEAEAALEPDIPERMIRTFLVQNLTPAEGGGLGWKLNLEAIRDQMPVIEGFPDIDSDDAFPRPALHLVGAESKYVLPRHHAEIERLFPYGEIEAIPDAGHWLHAEQPALFTEAVRTFLS